MVGIKESGDKGSRCKREVDMHGRGRSGHRGCGDHLAHSGNSDSVYLVPVGGGYVGRVRRSGSRSGTAS